MDDNQHALQLCLRDMMIFGLYRHRPSLYFDFPRSDLNIYALQARSTELTLNVITMDTLMASPPMRRAFKQIGGVV